MGIFDRFNPSLSEPNTRFWSWFLKNEERLSGLFDPLDLHKPVYAELTKEIKRVHGSIMPELYKDANGNKVLVISADGRRGAVEPVIALVDAAPEISEWRVERFRKPGPESIHIEYQGLNVEQADIRVAYKVDRQKRVVNIGVVLPGFTEDDKRFVGVGFLYLDHTIGEFNTIVHVGSIDFLAPGNIPEHVHLITLIELRRMIETEFY